MIKSISSCAHISPQVNVTLPDLVWQHLSLKEMHRSKTNKLYKQIAWPVLRFGWASTRSCFILLSQFFSSSRCSVTLLQSHTDRWKWCRLRGLPDSVAAVCWMKSWKDMHQVLNKAIRPSGMWNNGSFQVVVRCERSGGNWMRQKARLAAWLLALDLAALCQGNADRQARLSQHISASVHNPGSCRAGRLSFAQLPDPAAHSSPRSQWRAGACVTAFIWLKDSVRWEKGHWWHRRKVLGTSVVILPMSLY